MAEIYAGTGFNQIIKFDFDEKGKTKIPFGTMSRDPVHHIAFDY